MIVAKIADKANTAPIGLRPNNAWNNTHTLPIGACALPNAHVPAVVNGLKALIMISKMSLGA